MAIHKTHVCACGCVCVWHVPQRANRPGTIVAPQHSSSAEQVLPTGTVCRWGATAYLVAEHETIDTVLVCIRYYVLLIIVVCWLVGL